MNNIHRLGFLIILFSLISTACNSLPVSDPCSPTEIKETLEPIYDVSRRFLDSVELASSTSRIALSPVISDLQEIRRDAEDLDMPECADSAQEYLVKYMDTIIEGFLMFMADEPESQVNRQFENAVIVFNRFQEEIDDLTP